MSVTCVVVVTVGCVKLLAILLSGVIDVAISVVAVTLTIN